VLEFAGSKPSRDLSVSRVIVEDRDDLGQGSPYSKPGRDLSVSCVVVEDGDDLGQVSQYYLLFDKPEWRLREEVHECEGEEGDEHPGEGGQAPGQAVPKDVHRQVSCTVQ
jgi:hypothetical protein